MSLYLYFLQPVSTVPPAFPNGSSVFLSHRSADEHLSPTVISARRPGSGQQTCVDLSPVISSSDLFPRPNQTVLCCRVVAQ